MGYTRRKAVVEPESGPSTSRQGQKREMDVGRESGPGQSNSQAYSRDDSRGRSASLGSRDSRSYDYGKRRTRKASGARSRSRSSSRQRSYSKSQSPRGSRSGSRSRSGSYSPERSRSRSQDRQYRRGATRSESPERKRNGKAPETRALHARQPESTDEGRRSRPHPHRESQHDLRHRREGAPTSHLGNGPNSKKKKILGLTRGDIGQISNGTPSTLQLRRTRALSLAHSPAYRFRFILPSPDLIALLIGPGGWRAKSVKSYSGLSRLTFFDSEEFGGPLGELVGSKQAIADGLHGIAKVLEEETPFMTSALRALCGNVAEWTKFGEEYIEDLEITKHAFLDQIHKLPVQKSTQRGPATVLALQQNQLQLQQEHQQLHPNHHPQQQQFHQHQQHSLNSYASTSQHQFHDAPAPESFRPSFDRRQSERLQPPLREQDNGWGARSNRRNTFGAGDERPQIYERFGAGEPARPDGPSRGAYTDDRPPDHTMEIPREVERHVLGPRGSVIQGIERECQTRAFLERRIEPSPILQVWGTVQQFEMVVERIDRIILQHVPSWRVGPERMRLGPGWRKEDARMPRANSRGSASHGGEGGTTNGFAPFSKPEPFLKQGRYRHVDTPEPLPIERPLLERTPPLTPKHPEYDTASDHTEHADVIRPPGIFSPVSNNASSNTSVENVSPKDRDFSPGCQQLERHRRCASIEDVPRITSMTPSEIASYIAALRQPDQEAIYQALHVYRQLPFPMDGHSSAEGARLATPPVLTVKVTTSAQTEQALDVAPMSTGLALVERAVQVAMEIESSRGGEESLTELCRPTPATQTFDPAGPEVQSASAEMPSSPRQQDLASAIAATPRLTSSPAAGPIPVPKSLKRKQTRPDSQGSRIAASAASEESVEPGSSILRAIKLGETPLPVRLSFRFPPR